MVYKLGAVPEFLQMDNSSTATHSLEKGKKARDFNHSYKTFLNHYGVTPRSINVDCPDENGDIESANGHLKRRIEQSSANLNPIKFKWYILTKSAADNIINK